MDLSISDRQRLIKILAKIDEFTENNNARPFLKRAGLPKERLDGTTFSGSPTQLATQAVTKIEGWGHYNNTHALALLINVMLATGLDEDDTEFLRGLLGEDQKKN